MKLYLPTILFLCISSASFAAAYDASTLYNSVKRSSSVKDIFLERWDYIEENRYSLDLFGTINWVSDFQIYTTSRQPGQAGVKKPTSMRLVRTYGGAAFLIPLSYDSDTDSPDFLLGFSTYGYHYGLTKKTTINRGAAGSESVTDYKYTQFFDDIFAVSFFWSTYINVHTGVLVNNAIEPNDDGTMSYFDSSSARSSWFLSSNLFSFMNFNFLMKSNRLETFDINVSPTKIYAIFGGELPWYIPEITLGIKRLAMYNDMPFDAVWVKTNKTDSDEQDKASLTLFTLLLEKKFDALYINYYMAFQCASEKLIEKRTEKNLSLRPVKEMRATIGYDVFYNTPLKLIPEAGLCQYWDEAMPFHSKSDTYKANGMFGSVDLGYRSSDNFLSAGLKFTCSYNDSKELNKLIETTGKMIVQGDFYISLKLYDW